MKKLIYCLLICLCAVNQSQAQKYNPYNPHQTRQPSEWSGTGWALNKGYIVTNHHVADNAHTIRVRFSQGDTTVQYTAEVVLMDEETDLALLKINDPTFKGFGQLPYALKTSLADVGESVFVLGYPMTTTMGDEIKLTTGIISSHSGFQGSTAQYQISAPVQPGNSGGPLFDDNGNIIGVVNAKHSDAENVSYAIKAINLQNLVSRLQDKAGIIPTNNSLAGLTLPQKVRRVKDLVCFIYCSSRGETPRTATPKYGAPIVPQGNKTINRPYIDFTRTEDTRILSITLTDTQTIIEMSHNNTTYGKNEWINIDRNTVIEVGGQQYKLVKTEGIAIDPKMTYFTGPNETKTFRLIFPAIPKAATSINLIEPGNSDWKFYGISLKEY